MKRQVLKRWSTLLLALVLVLTMAVPAMALEVDGDTDARIRELVRDNYYQKLDAADIQFLELDQLLGLLDEHSGYLSAEEFGVFDSSVEGRFGGIGVQVSTEQSRVVITGILPGTPAEAVGLQIGDKFRSVNGEDVRQVPQAELVPMLRGEPGSVVLLEVDRGDGVILASISRRVIDVSGKQARIDDDGIGYFTFNTFASDIGGWFTGHVIKGKMENNLHGIVLDLRGNSGGRLGSGLNVAAAILDNGEVITRIYSQGEERNSYRSATPGFEGPVVVLTDGGSASASEFVTAALVEGAGALHVGTPTFGKGRIQSVYTLPNGDRLKLTTAEYKSPSAQKIDGLGLTPDVVLEDRDAQLAYAYAHLQDLMRFYGFQELTLRAGALQATVNGEDVALPAAVRQVDGRTLVPLRFVGESMRVAVDWTPGGAIRIWNDRSELILQTGNRAATLNGETLTLDVPVQVVDGVSYVPLRVLAESFGYGVSFDGATGQVTVGR